MDNYSNNTQNYYNNANGYSNNGQNLNNGFDNPQYPMKWFKFLIYFGLFAGGILNFAAGIRYLTGEIYATENVTAELVYGLLGDSLKTLDIIYGIGAIAVAVLQIVTRFRLAGYKENGPMLLYVVYGVSLMMAVVYIVGFTMVVDSKLIDMSEVTSSLTTTSAIQLAILIANVKYFSKRKHMFRN